MDQDDLVDDVMGKLKRALGEIDGEGLRDAVREGLKEAMRALDDGNDDDDDDDDDDDVIHLDDPDDEASDNVVQLSPGGDAGAQAGVSVRVLRGGLDDGSIRVADGWQTVYVGMSAAPYRLVVSRGQLEVTVDDATVAQLTTGQTCDVEGRTIRVRGTGTGRYRRL